MEQEAFRRLLRRYIQDDCTNEERKILEDLVLRNPLMGKWDWSSEEERVLTGIRIKQAVDKHRLGKGKVRNRVWRLINIAAALLIVSGICWSIVNQITDTENDLVRISETSAFPDDGVRLALGDGRVIRLDSVANGSVQKSNGVAIKKNDNGKLEYVSQDKKKSGMKDAADPINTIHVPNGKQFQLTLPDASITR